MIGFQKLIDKLASLEFLKDVQIKNATHQIGIDQRRFVIE